MKAADAQILADFLHQGLALRLDRAALQAECRERRHIRRIVFCHQLRQGGGEIEKICVLGHEIGFAIDLYQCGAFAVIGKVGADHAFGRDAPGGLVRFGAALHPQQVFSGFQVAAGLDQGFLALHHAQPGDLAQLPYHGCGNFCHLFAPSVRYKTIGKHCLLFPYARGRISHPETAS